METCYRIQARCWWDGWEQELGALGKNYCLWSPGTQTDRTSTCGLDEGLQLKPPHGPRAFGWRNIYTVRSVIIKCSLKGYIYMHHRNSTWKWQEPWKYNYDAMVQTVPFERVLPSNFAMSKRPDSSMSPDVTHKVRKYLDHASICLRNSS